MYALVTGASAGIGMEIAKYLAVKGYDLILTARREDRLEKLRGQIISKYPDRKVLVIPADLSKREECVRLFEECCAQAGSGNIDCAWMAASFKESESSCSLSPGWLRNSHQLVVRSESGIKRKNNLKVKVLGITDATSLAALKEDGLFEKITSVWYYDDLNACFNALAAGDCDAVVIDSIVSAYYV